MSTSDLRVSGEAPDVRKLTEDFASASMDLGSSPTQETIDETFQKAIENCFPVCISLLNFHLKKVKELPDGEPLARHIEQYIKTLKYGQAFFQQHGQEKPFFSTVPAMATLLRESKADFSTLIVQLAKQRDWDTLNNFIDHDIAHDNDNLPRHNWDPVLNLYKELDVTTRDELSTFDPDALKSKLEQMSSDEFVEFTLTLLDPEFQKKDVFCPFWINMMTVIPRELIHTLGFKFLLMSFNNNGSIAYDERFMVFMYLKNRPVVDWMTSLGVNGKDKFRLIFEVLRKIEKANEQEEFDGKITDDLSVTLEDYQKVGNGMLLGIASELESASAEDRMTDVIRSMTTGLKDFKDDLPLFIKGLMKQKLWKTLNTFLEHDKDFLEKLDHDTVKSLYKELDATTRDKLSALGVNELRSELEAMSEGQFAEFTFTLCDPEFQKKDSFFSFWLNILLTMPEKLICSLGSKFMLMVNNKNDSSPPTERVFTYIYLKNRPFMDWFFRFFTKSDEEKVDHSPLLVMVLEEIDKAKKEKKFEGKITDKISITLEDYQKTKESLFSEVSLGLESACDDKSHDDLLFLTTKMKSKTLIREIFKKYRDTLTPEEYRTVIEKRVYGLIFRAALDKNTSFIRVIKRELKKLDIDFLSCVCSVVNNDGKIRIMTDPHSFMTLWNEFDEAKQNEIFERHGFDLAYDVNFGGGGVWLLKEFSEVIGPEKTKMALMHKIKEDNKEIELYKFLLLDSDVNYQGRYNKIIEEHLGKDAVDRVLHPENDIKAEEEDNGESSSQIQPKHKKKGLQALFSRRK